jgi:hypothetical protein
VSDAEQLEVLSALKASHTRVLEVLLMMAPLVQRQADQGDSLARYIITELEKAWTVMASENVAASAFVAEATSGG